MTGEKVLNDLSKVNWNVAARTFGNNHATLIGLLVAWWVSGKDPLGRLALEGAPAFAPLKKGQHGSGFCDALFCQGDPAVAVGVLEVEGCRPKPTVEKFGKYFSPAAKEPNFKSLEFAILLLYAGKAVGRGSKRHYLPALDLEIGIVSRIYG